MRPAADGDTAAAAEFADVVEFADAITAPVTLDVPPPIVAAAASTPAGAQAAGGCRSPTTSSWPVPAVPLDVSSAVDVDRGEEFARLLGAGEDMLTEAVPTTPSRRNAWVVLDPLSGAGAQELRDLGFRFLVMTEDVYRAPSTPTSPTTDLFVDRGAPRRRNPPADRRRPALGGPHRRACRRDPDLVDPDRVGGAERSRRCSSTTSAGLALERSRVLSTPDLVAPDARLVTGLESIAATTPSIEFVEAVDPHGDAPTNRPCAANPSSSTLPDTAGPSLAARVELIDSTALSAASAGSMLPPDDPRPDRWATTLNALLSTAIDDDQAAAVAAQIQAEADALRGAVVPPQPFTFTLTGRSGDIEVQVGNTSAEPLDVVLRFSSPKLSFPESTPPPDDPDADRRRRPRRHPAPERRDLGRHPGAGEVERHVAASPSRC